MYKAIDLSKYIVNKCISENSPISNLQLQKILYYIQEDYIKGGNEAFSDNIEAWQFGPVVPNVYYYYCGNGSMPIYDAFDTFSIQKEEDKTRIDSIVKRKRRLSPWALVADTHTPGGPWDTVYDGGRGERQVIPVDLIKKWVENGHQQRR